MTRSVVSTTTTLLSFLVFFLLSLLVAFSVITLASIEEEKSARVVNAYGVLSTRDPIEIERVQEEIKNRLKNTAIRIINSDSAESNIIVVAFSQANGPKKLRTYLNTVENVDKWIFDDELQTTTQTTEHYLRDTSLFIFLVSLFALLVVLVFHLKSSLALHRQDIEIWKNLGATNAQVRHHFFLPLLMPPGAGISLALAFAFFVIRPQSEPRIEGLDLGPILLSMSQSPSIVSEIVLPTPELGVAEPRVKLPKREWAAPLEEFWSRKRIKNIESTRQGILLEAKSGEMVTAASDGVVVYEGQMRGLGKMVILDHGRGLHSVYAHLGDIKTRIDETLQKGQTLGYIGDNVFYFELRQNGKPKAVENFIRRP